MSEQEHELGPRREDLYAVKERGNGFDEWCVVAICRTYVGAQRALARRDPLPGYMLTKKIVHPRQRVVDMFLLAGNSIEE